MKTARSWKMPITLAGAGLLALSIWASPAAAQRSDDMRGGGQHPCTSDAQRLCSDAIPDRAKVASCLFKHQSQLAPACRTAMGGGKASVGKKAKGKRKGKRSRRR